MFEKDRKISFITLLIMPRLSKHDESSTIGMLQAGLCVTDISQYYNSHPSTMQVLRDHFQATGTVKIDTGLVNQELQHVVQTLH